MNYFVYKYRWSTSGNSKCKSYFIFFSNNRNSQKITEYINFSLAKSKLNSFETLVSQAFIDMEIRHEEFITILKENDKYEKMKDNLRSENEKYEIMRLSSIKLKT